MSAEARNVELRAISDIGVHHMDTPRRPRGDSWAIHYFSDEEDDSNSHNKKDKLTVRDAWQLITSNIGRRLYGVLPQQKRIEVKQILLKWRNPNPSVSVKHISNRVSMELGSDALESSCFVDGFRIVQNVHGDIFAEFCLIFAYGSRSFLNWKSYTEFNDYLKILKEIHNRQPIFPQTMSRWEELQVKMKWQRCLSVPYLIKKSILLSHVAQASFLESPTPAILFEFVQLSR